MANGELSLSDLDITFKKYMCVICGFIYDEAEGWPEDGIEPGTKWEDVPENWYCPDCGASKSDFQMIEVVGSY
ncbi:MAG: rubredoxin [Legionellales bacterium RIFCSPHIGHO2_12_FULL_37_14]|nr:MAG: rubredoxin [Legionellales bacterium RIFCSPHIGHO2_12_FULL_37_14]